MTTTQNLKLNEHLAQQGLRTDLPFRAVKQKLRELMGRSRYSQYLSTARRYDAGCARIGELYHCVRTLEEANLLFSMQGAVSVAAGRRLAHECVRHAPQHGRVLELGCWTGGVTSYIADVRPDLQVVGVDRLGPLVDQASRRHRLPNLSFANWDYSAGADPQLGKFDLLVSSFGIDFDAAVERDYSSRPGACRGSPGHAISYREAQPYLANWHMVANAGAILAVVLRVGCVGHALAVLDAAADAGWSVQLNRSHRFEAGDETFPLFVFAAGGKVRQVDETTLSRWWWEVAS